ncbi:MAG TPA: Gfo/Idh/MocA family oxidoreductase, partial [Chthoniobacterales bacterium]|nr:Gfo/Idh/MocA family oxidoreductase [Chthoniobacterales bacterium]
IDIVDICAPNDSHREIAVAAAKAGKAILCEKPLALNAGQAQQMAAAVKRARVANMVCHNYRRIPAIALAKQMINRGEVGNRIFHCRARYAQDWIVDPKFPLVWRLQSSTAGSGALGDIFSHIVDLSRYLVGELSEICAQTETFIRHRPSGGGQRRTGKVTVDDAVSAIGRFENGALFTLEATRFAPGRKNSITLEINGNGGSLFFDLEQMNYLKFYSRRDSKGGQGFRNIIVTEPSHPYIKEWWPPGHMIGYEHTFVHTVADFVKAVATGKPAQPDFGDAVRTQHVLDAALQSAHKNKWIKIRK